MYCIHFVLLPLSVMTRSDWIPNFLSKLAMLIWMGLYSCRTVCITIVYTVTTYLLKSLADISLFTGMNVKSIDYFLLSPKLYYI